MNWDKILKNSFDLSAFSKLPYDTQLAQAEKQKFNPSHNVKETVEDINKKAQNQVLPTNQKRILNELTGFMNHPPNPRFKIFPNVNDILFWKVLLIGPSGSPYSNGVFQLTIKFGNNYPTTKPEIKFVTKIYHLNVKQGGLDVISGLSILDNWCSTKTIALLLTAVDEMLVGPNHACGVANDIMAQYYADKAVYEQKATQCVDDNNPKVEDLMEFVYGADLKTNDLPTYTALLTVMQTWLDENKNVPIGVA